MLTMKELKEIRKEKIFISEFFLLRTDIHSVHKRSPTAYSALGTPLGAGGKRMKLHHSSSP